MENLSALIEVQRNANRHLQRMMADFDKKPQEQLTKGYIQTVLEEVELTYKNFKADHEQICEAVLESSVQETTVPYLNEDFYYVFFNTYLTLKSKLLDLAVEPASSNHQLSSTFVPPNIQNTSFTSSTRLPKIELPIFAGEYIDWIPYRDMFLSLVHNNQSLTGIQKYFYLKGSCKGSPLEIINQYPASEHNYSAAWRALGERYHNSRKIVDQIFKKLFNIPMSNGSFKSIKELLDSTRSAISLLKSVDIEDMFDAMLVFLTSQKLDKQTRREWEQSITTSNVIPPMASMLSFLEMTFRTLESVEEVHESSKCEKTSSKIESHSAKQKPQHKSYRRSLYTNNATVDNINCPCCQRRHPLYKCFKFSSLPPAEKKTVILKNKICSNCLHSGHSANQCTSSARCQQCKLNHHTILHSSYLTESSQQQSATHCSTTADNVNQRASRSFQSNEQYCSHISSPNINTRSQVLLATAKVNIKHKTGIHTVKALIDPGSQASFITQEVAQLLDLRKQKINETSVCGIGVNNKTSINFCVHLQLLSNYNKNFQLNIDALVMSRLTSYKPNNLKNSDLPNLKQYHLSDPTFHLPSKINILLGSDVYGEILLSNSIKFPNSVYLQESYFGWLVSGPTGNRSTEPQVNINMCSLENLLRQFWVQEELSEERKLTIEEELCEKFFTRTCTKESNGSYTVHLPFKKLLFENDLPVFYNTHYSALKRFKQLESSFKFRPQFAAAYKTFMAEYLRLNHMEKIGKYPQDIPPKCFFFPHHGVLRESSATTKLRVVFDGSNKNGTQTSLNEELSPGPALQNDLPEVITRWRRFKIGFTADLEKMFRQINICDEHQIYQCILWRDENTNDINIYKLKTVTYGTTCAPFLAIRVLKQIAYDGAEIYPLASKVLQSDIYVDDVISGADTLNEAIQLQQELRSLLDKANFNLRKWNSNSTQLPKQIPSEYLAITNIFQLQNHEMVKALGLSWDPKTDKFCFKINYSFSDKITKSSVLSDSARLFDPLGWLAPTTILAKIMFQRLWREGLDWSDALPKEMSDEWSNYRIALKDIETIQLPRWFNCISTDSTELHAFCDASKLALAAVLYLRVTSDDGTIHVSLIQSKTKVAPLKVQTIPKLELCAAVLSAKLVNKVKRNIGLEVNKITYWSDSTTVLNWIKSQSSTLPVYEANRVSQLQRLTNVVEWRYVFTKDNPADCATRGLLPHDLRNYTLWWKGPHWLSENPEKWPTKNIKNTIPVTSSDITAYTTTTTKETPDSKPAYPEWYSKFSTFSKLQRVTAYILRYYFNLKECVSRKKNRETVVLDVKKLDNIKLVKHLTTFELERAKFELVKQCQKVSFYDEIKCLLKQRCLPNSSRIRNLQPFLDEDGVLRVGGRIKNANLSFSKKHPILLTKKDPISILIFTDIHFKTLHGGVQLMQSYVMSHYWIISARNLAKLVKRKCVICLKYSAKASHQIMGNLPAVRIHPARPFKHSGLDYAGPIMIKQSSLRRSSISKGYICLFVCMCTKAVHLEIVSSLTTEAFLAAFRRFISRRGPCTELYSDCGTTFIGADKELRALHNRSRSSLPDDLAETLNNDGTKWNFIPLLHHISEAYGRQA